MRLPLVRRLPGPIPSRARAGDPRGGAAPLAPGPSITPSVGRMPRASLFVVLVVAIAGAGCTGARANSHYRYPRDVAYGKPSTCPAVRLPPLRDGGVSPDAARCSYADANGARVTHLAGKVVGEAGPGDPGVGVPQVAVTVHAIKGPVFDVNAPG